VTGSSARPADAGDDYVAFIAMWTPLGERTGAEKVLGLVGAFWKRDEGLIKVRAADFTAFDRPGFGKVALGYTVLPYGTRSILTTETRVVLTDDVARARFARYWLVVGPGARFVMARALRLIKADAEGRAA
jgi:hypothetical protein